MAKEFKSRMGKVYYIKPKLTKKGNTSYFLTRKLDKTCLGEVPEGFEVYENYPASMLYIRKKKPRIFTQQEIDYIKSELDQNDTIDGYALNIDGGVIKIYDFLDKTRDLSSEYTKNQMASLSPYLMQYTENMKIKKVVKNGLQEFTVMRYCYIGAIDDWIIIDAGDSIEELAKRNLKHLGKESLFSLHPIK